MKHENDPFAEIMEIVGYNCRFQKIYVCVYVFGLTFVGAMIYMNIILALNVPNHWCSVPNRNNTNFTINEWKNLTLPITTDNRGENAFSTCKMYNISFNEIVENSMIYSNYSEIECKNGYEYDTMYYDESIPTKENWVCEKDLYVTNTFVVSRITEVMGNIVLGQLGDIYGRKLVYYFSLIIVILGRSLSILTTSSFLWFTIGTGIAGFTINSMFISPIIIGMEISKDDDRARLTMVQSFGWSFATTFMPLLYWWFRHWAPFMWITTLSSCLILFFVKYMIESPRWLISKKKFSEAHQQFVKMAKINGRTFTLTEKEIAKMFSEVKQETTYGFASLFRGWRLAKNTIIMGFSWCVVGVSYFTLVLFSSRMGGNPFLNFLLQSVVEIPAYMLGKYMGDRIGRRITNISSFLVSGFACIPIIFLASNPAHENIVIGIAVFIKFLNGLTFFAAGLQSMEIYPTCIRQTGISLGAILTNAIGVLAPYFVYLGTNYDIRAPYYILTILFFMGGIGAMFLPETLHRKLPDTLEEAKNFGKEQAFWSLPKPANRYEETNLEERRKLKSEAN